MLAARFASEVNRRHLEVTDDDLYAKEIRHVTVELVIPFTNWTHYKDTLERYQRYHQVPTSTLVHIYPEEQNAFRVGGIIAQKIDRNFGGNSLDPSVTALLGEFALFETFALILTE